METIFDYGVTNKELLDIVGGSMPNEKEYIERRSQDTAYGDLFFLFYGRGSMRKAEYYANKVTDVLFRYDLYRIATHP